MSHIDISALTASLWVLGERVYREMKTKNYYEEQRVVVFHLRLSLCMSNRLFEQYLCHHAESICLKWLGSLLLTQPVKTWLLLSEGE